MIVLAIAAVIGAAGGFFLFLSGSRGLMFMDRMYSTPLPGKLRPRSERR